MIIIILLLEYHISKLCKLYFKKFTLRKDLNFLYLLQFGYYIQLLINLVFIDEKLDDFYEMLTHHIVTLIMVSLSYLTL